MSKISMEEWWEYTLTLRVDIHGESPGDFYKILAWFEEMDEMYGED